MHVLLLVFYLFHLLYDLCVYIRDNSSFEEPKQEFHKRDKRIESNSNIETKIKVMMTNTANLTLEEYVYLTGPFSIRNPDHSELKGQVLQLLKETSFFGKDHEDS